MGEGPKAASGLLRWRDRLGLRARAAAAFALGALLLSVVLSSLTYGITRSYLLRQRESSAVRQTFVNAQLIRSGLRPARPDVPQLLGTIDTTAGSQSVLRHSGRWFATSLVVGRDALPSGLRTQVIRGRPARQRYRLDGRPQLAVGVPLPAVDAQYFEVSDLSELDRTLRILSASLVGAAAATTIAGAALGRWASRRVLAPLSQTARAAAAVGGGRLATRLPPSQDADLAVLTSSFNRMVDALQERIERDARFASDVSHELRSPLTTLAASLEVLEGRRAELPERACRALDLLAADVKRFQRLVEDLLEISRYDAGAAELALEDVRLGELLEHALPTPGLNGVLDVDPEAGGTVVRADKRRLERVVTNLLTNAERYGGGAVRVGVTRGNGAVRVEVDDAGPGIPETERERIFERFARGAAAGRRTGSEGVGLGLSLVAEHVRLHGGRVWAEERPGGGARFVVELPVVKEEA